MKYKQFSYLTSLLTVLSIVFVVIVINQTNKYITQRKEHSHEKLLETRIKQNPEKIISEIEDLILAGNFLTAYRTANQFKKFKNTKIEELASQAWEEHCEQHEKQIIAKLKKIPATQYKANINEYTKLVSMFPENEIYKYKLKHYREKLKAQEEKLKAKEEKKRKERERCIAKFGEPPTSDWGCFLATLYLKNWAHDPSSVDVRSCTKVYHTKDGWLIGCTYRAMNKFGALTLTSNWFIIEHDTIIDVKEASAYGFQTMKGVRK